MARDLFITPTVPDAAAITVRLGAGAGAANNLTQAEVGKFVRLVGESRYNLCAVGEPIEGVIYAVELAPQNAYTVGSMLSDVGLRLWVTFDGLQATPGTGVVAVGDLVVAGTPVAKGTPLTPTTNYPKVCKATAQTTDKFNWRVVSLGTVGTGAVGTVGVIERI